MNKLSMFLIMITAPGSYAQGDLPYREIPSYPDTYTAANVAARVIDGLGFRYYWATEASARRIFHFSQTKTAAPAWRPSPIFMS